MRTASSDSSGEPSAEAELLAELRRGDARAFERLVRDYGPRMLAVIRRYLRSDADAQDALQDAFVNCFKSIGQFNGSSMLSTWLHTVACRAALMKLRSNRRLHEEGDIESLLPTYRSDGHRTSRYKDWPSSPSVMLESKESRQIVRDCIEQLPDAFRYPLLLRDIDEIDTDEAAQALGLTPAALKSRLHRARQALRTLLARKFVSLG